MSPEPAGAEVPADVVGLLRPGHPRLIVDAAELDRVVARCAADPRAAARRAALLERAGALLDEPPARYGRPDGRTLLPVARTVLTRVYELSLAHRLTGEARFAERGYAELAAAAAFPDWNPESFLSTAELLHGLAVGYDWLHDHLDDGRRALVANAVLDLGLRPALAAHAAGAFWTTARHNWNIVCNGGVVLGALAVGERAPDLANELLRRALAALPVALAEFAPDGGYPEGVGYWGYAVRYLVPTIAALRSAVGTDFGLSRAEGLDRTGEFRLQLTGPTGRSFNYYDSVDHESVAALHWLADWYDQPACAWWAARVAAERGDAEPPLHLMGIGRSPAVSPGRLGLARDRLFARTQTYVTRGAWDRAEATFVGFKAGDNATNHADLDLGTLVVDALGVRWALDLGPEAYGLPGYWERGPGGRRWNYYRKRAEGHNTLVVGPGSSPDPDPGTDSDPGAGAGPDQDPTARGAVVRTRAAEDGSLAVADLSAAYAHRGVTAWRRGVALVDDRSRVLVQDELTARGPVDLWWFLHTRAAIALSPDGQTATLRQDGRTLLARLLAAPPGARFTVRPAHPLPSSPAPAGQSTNPGVRKLTLAVRSVTEARLTVLLDPVPDPATGLRRPAPPVRPLARWG